MIYRMDTVTFLSRYLKKETPTAIVATKYVTISHKVWTAGTDTVTSWAHYVVPDVVNYITMDEDFLQFQNECEQSYELELHIFAEVILQALKENDRLIFLYTQEDEMRYYPSIFCSYLEKTLGISIYTYGDEIETDRPYNRIDAMDNCKQYINMAAYDKLIKLPTYSLNKKELKFILKYLKISPKGMDEEDMVELITDIKRRSIALRK